MIEIKDTKESVEIKDVEEAKAVKDKVNSLLKDEKINQEKEFSTDQDNAIRLKSEQSLLLRYSVSSLLLLLMGLALFYAAYVSKADTESQYQQQLKSQSNKEISSVVKQASANLKGQIQAFSEILGNIEKIPFESESELKLLKNKLKSSLNNSISIQIISPDYQDDKIIDDPDMGYTLLFLLNELKKAKNIPSENLTKFELYKGNTKDKKLLLIQKAVHNNVAIAYVIVSLSTDFIQHLLTDQPVDYHPNI